ncbi:NAD-dependent epimerase/dehydratase family protein [Aureimonas fodinaquatilis]|uniref:NAD-dependent epimerase/dehydratase family protein n=1 Tax=Aureimonas fodinaquatilis TaxID=2565783 RepID=A0A5B0E056_9HYPH|nr:NAD-dependent epimerase/dehydratase family protein [Aureimonas fodinaquatilis]KAA0970859.1 NAD-dependent epimerase/dehydratase family protein [Aureimonas fodinaquatilis]
MQEVDDGRVLVSGASGFIAKHIVAGLLGAGHTVRGTVRNAEKARQLRQTMQDHAVPVNRLETVEADLLQDEGWAQAAKDCRYVMHTASPFPQSQPNDREALVPAAVGGTLRVVEAAKAAGVERIVLTSSVASVFYGHERKRATAYGEADFSNTQSPHISAYAISKTRAEQAAWASVQGSTTQLTTINPSLVFGPVLDSVTGTSAKLVAMLMNGRLPALPNMRFGMVDVRDVAEAHIRAMGNKNAAGRRFIVSSQTLPLQALAPIIVAQYPELKKRMPRLTIPDWTIRMAALFSSKAAMLADEVASDRILDTQPAESILGLHFRSAQEGVLALADSLIRYGLVELPEQKHRKNHNL